MDDNFRSIVIKQQSKNHRICFLLSAILSLTIHMAHCQHYLKDRTTPLVPMSEYTAPERESEQFVYPEDYRILDCWQCFEAKGKMCVDKNR